MPKPAITFIVPAFNVEGVLGQTLESLRMQVREDWSAVVVDDGSTDRTAEVAAAFARVDPRISVVQQENRGLSGARNRGIEACAGRGGGEGGGGEVLCFLDSDDVVLPRFTEVMLEALKDRFDVAACWYSMAGPNLEDLGWVVRTGDHDMSPGRLIEFNPVACGAIVVRRSALERVLIETPFGNGIFDTSLSVHEDWDAWLRLSAAPELGGAGARWAPMVPEPLFCYRQRSGSMSGQLERMWRTGLEVIERAPVAAELKPGALRRWSIRHVARAAARGDAALAGMFMKPVGALVDDEPEFLAGCVRWALCQYDQVGPAQVNRKWEQLWGLRILRVLGPEVGAVVLSQIRFGQDLWQETIERLSREMGPLDVLVIYGLGRNGRDLVGALERAGWRKEVRWMDDDAFAPAPMLAGRMLQRISMQALGPQHVVVVTPDQSSRLVELLRHKGVERVVVRGGRSDLREAACV